nr:polyprenyl diphosphate synthase [uncultured Porphyromonas sp.]
MSSPADTLLAQLDPDRIPTHTAIIMDGNGRWACERGLERREGHRAGVQTVSRIVRAAARCGIRYLTLYTFSTENWRRPRAEVDALMTLLVRSAVEELTTLEENNVRLRTIGDLKGLPDEPREALQGLVESTKSNTGITLVLAVNYSSRSELTRAFNRLMSERSSDEPITADDITAHLDLPDLPDPDLLIRTGGECRISNYLLWQLAYTELYFCDLYWPDFGAEDLYRALLDYQSRQRRFGRTGDQVADGDESTTDHS